MSLEHSPSCQPEDLSGHQSLILEGFAQAYVLNPSSPQETALYDQSTTAMRENITGGFGLALDTPKEFYAVMAGLSAATDKMERLIGMGLPPAIASKVLRQSLAGLMPTAPNPKTN